MAQKSFSIAWNFGFSPTLTGRRKMSFDDRTLDEMIRDLPLPHEFDTRGILKINGMEILRSTWKRVRLNENSPVPLAVTLHMAPRDPGTAILTAAGSTKGAVAFALTAAAINFAVGLALQLIVNALTGRPEQEGKQRREQDRTASLDGNVLDVNQALPRVLGTHRVYPPLLTHPLVELRGQDEYVEAVLALAGPHRIDNVYAQDVLLYDRVSGVSEIDGVEIQVREGFNTDSAINTVVRQSYTDETRYELSYYNFVTDSFVNLTSSKPYMVQSNSVAWGAGRFVAVGVNGAFTSTDGVTWVQATALPFTAYKVIYTGTQFVAVGANGGVARSTNGLTWTSSTGNMGSAAILALAYNGTRYVAGGDLYSSTLTSQMVWTSTNGTSWTLQFIPGFNTDGVRDINWNGTRFVAVGQNGAVATSTNGTSWTFRNGLRTSAWGSTEDVMSVTWNGTQYVAVGQLGRVATSPDGTTWTNRNGLRTTAWGSGASSTVRSVVWNGAQFVVVGDGGKVATSPDGITWTYQAGLIAAGWNGDANSIAWSGTTYSVVGVPAAASSTNATTWAFNPSHFELDAIPQWHSVSTREAPDEFWIQLNAPSGIYDGDDTTKRVRVPFRLQMRERGSPVWENLPEIHIQTRSPSQLKATVKIIWGVFPGKKTPPTNKGWVYGAPRTQAQAIAPGVGPWTTSAYWGDTGAYTYTTSANLGTMNNVVLSSEAAEFWLDPSIYPKGRYEFRIKRGQALINDDFTASTYTYIDGVYDPFYYYENPQARIRANQENRNSQFYLTRVSSIWSEHPTPVVGDMAIIAIRAKNQQLPAIHCTASGMVYDWDGAGWNTLTTSSNPAVAFRHLLNNSVSTDPLPTTMIDNQSIVDWRTHCIAKGYECNMVVQDTPMKDVLDRVAGCGFAIPVQSEVWGASWERDRSAEPVVQVFTGANSKNFSYKKGFARFTDALRVQFRNADENYEPREEIVYATGGSITNPRMEQVEYSGLTTVAEVTRRANYDLQENQSRTVFYSLDADADAIVCRRGDLVVVHSDVLTGQATAGYIATKTVAAGLITTIALDASVELGAGPNVVVVRADDGTITTASIAEVSVTTSTLTLTGALADSADIGLGTLVAVGEGGVAVRRLIVTEISPGQDLTCTLTLADEAPELLALI